MIFRRRRTKDTPTDTPGELGPDETAEAPEADPTWQAGTASWWAISVVVTALAITAFTGLRTISAASEPVPATRILESVLRAPTAELMTDELADADADTERLDARDDLVAFDVAVDAARDDFQATVEEAVEARAAHLYTEGIPGDPGPTRTQVGLPRRFVGALTVDNHDAAGDSVRYAGILALALLAWTFLQGRNDNLIMLPAGALATGWILSTAARQAVDLVLGDIGPGSDRTVQTIERAAAAPMAQLSLLTVAALASAAFFRLLTIAQRWLADRSEPDAPTAPTIDLDTVTDGEDADVPDRTDHDLETHDPVLVESVPSLEDPRAPVRLVPVRRRMDVDV